MCSIIRKVWIGLWITTKICLKFKEIHLCCYLLKQKQCCASNYIEFTSTAEMYLSSTLSLVGFCLFPIISISFGLLAHSHEQNKTGTKDHELIVQLINTYRTRLWSYLSFEAKWTTSEKPTKGLSTKSTVATEVWRPLIPKLIQNIGI